MNARIEELKRKATVPTAQEGLGGPYYELDPDLFAELIIRECSVFVDPITRIRLLKHFGVEE